MAVVSYASGQMSRGTSSSLVGSTAGSKGDPVEVPDAIHVEASGFATSADAAKAAGARYGQEGVDGNKKLQLAIIKLGEGDYGYLTPGWGPEGSTTVDFSDLLAAYKGAGYRPFAWMHGHFDHQLNFSANDFDLV